MTDYLSRPVNSEDLSGAVRIELHRSRKCAVCKKMIVRGNMVTMVQQPNVMIFHKKCYHGEYKEGNG